MKITGLTTLDILGSGLAEWNINLCQHLLVTLREGFPHTLVFSTDGGVYCHLWSFEMQIPDYRDDDKQFLLCCLLNMLLGHMQGVLQNVGFILCFKNRCRPPSICIFNDILVTTWEWDFSIEPVLIQNQYCKFNYSYICIWEADRTQSKCFKGLVILERWYEEMRFL